MIFSKLKNFIEKEVGTLKFYIADTHFGHENCIRFDNRPFSDIEEMDRILIENWNNRVQPEDEVYIVGDFIYRNKNHDFEWYLRQLKGHKFLVTGNHDGKLLRDEQSMRHFDGVDRMMNINDGSHAICLCHFPIVSWDRKYHGSYQIYGHIHSNIDEDYYYMKTQERALNAGCMINGYMPVNFEEMIKNNKLFQQSH